MTVTSGVLSQRPMPGSAAISLVNAGLEGFVRAAAPTRRSAASPIARSCGPNAPNPT